MSLFDPCQVHDESFFQLTFQGKSKFLPVREKNYRYLCGFLILDIS